MSESNQSPYSEADVIEHYARMDGLFPPETYLVDKYLKDSSDIFDIGVGAGRTTPYLAARGRTYLGADYSPGMVQACRTRYPEAKFVVADATDLSDFDDQSFDFIIFSFNGIDTIPSDLLRLKALQELRRVLRHDGVLIISSHNARHIFQIPRTAGLGLARKLSTALRTFVNRTLPMMHRMLRSGAFVRGRGYVLDPAHGGMLVHTTTPKRVVAEAASCSLEVIETIGAYYPKRVPEIMNPWSTFVLRRI